MENQEEEVDNQQQFNAMMQVCLWNDPHLHLNDYSVDYITK